MLTPTDVIDFLNFLDSVDSVSIEENQNREEVTLDDIKAHNKGNNCLHYILVHNNHRIVIQTYKELVRKGNIDIVQGKPELEPIFEDKIEAMNSRPQDYTDDQLNKLFVLYCGIWQKCSASYKAEMDTDIFEFGPDMQVCYDNPKNKWIVTIDGVPMQSTMILYNFITAIENICK